MEKKFGKDSIKDIGSSFAGYQRKNCFYAILFEMKKEYPKFVEEYFMRRNSELIAEFVPARKVLDIESIYFDYEISQYYIENKEIIFSESGYKISQAYLNRIDKLNTGRQEYLNSGNRIILS